MMRETATNQTWDDTRSTYRQDFDRRYGATGARWEEAEPAYHYGHTMAVVYCVGCSCGEGGYGRRAGGPRAHRRPEFP